MFTASVIQDPGLYQPSPRPVTLQCGEGGDGENIRGEQPLPSPSPAPLWPPWLEPFLSTPFLLCSSFGGCWAVAASEVPSDGAHRGRDRARDPSWFQRCLRATMVRVPAHSVPQFPLCILGTSPLSGVFSRTSGKRTGCQWAPDSIQRQSPALSTLMGRVARGHKCPSFSSSDGAAQGGRVWVLPLGSALGRIRLACLLERCWGLSLVQGTRDCCHCP